MDNDTEQLYPPNATLIERVVAYMHYDLHEHAEELALVGDHLEDCLEWDIDFE